MDGVDVAAGAWCIPAPWNYACE